MTTPDNDKLVTFGTLMKMFEAFAENADRPEPVRPIYDEATGRYTNESIVAWMESFADGKVYGVQVPLYSFSMATTATKTDANAGLVLEPSTNEAAGRNDYLNKKLFMCPRVNGGVDADGMPYVTAIEGEDDRFDCKTANTWALTPVYYVKYTQTEEYIWQQYTDTPTEGFSACAGAYTANDVLRPYILRACYMDSDGQCSSKSGPVPASNVYEGVPARFKHSFSDDFFASRNRSDGMTFLSFADVTYVNEFMQLMLGMKGVSNNAKGYIQDIYYLTTVAANTGKSVIIAASDAWMLRVGSYISVGTVHAYDSYEGCSIAYCVRITGMEVSGDKATVALDVPEDITTSEGNCVTTVPYRNGACDDVLGTYGCFDLEGMTDKMAPFRFQNMEWGLGYDEIVVNMLCSSVGDVTIAPDVSACTDLIAEDGWHPVGKMPAAGWIRDHGVSHSARIPTATNATSTTGSCAYYMNSGAGRRGFAMRGRYGNGSSGVASVMTLPETVGGGLVGSRASSIGHSVLAEQ